MVMAIYQRGSKGDEVGRFQGKLRDAGFYRGPLDGRFGGGTESAVIAFQRSKGLSADGKVGARTWAALFGTRSIPAPALLGEDLSYRCLALTGSFETNLAPPD